MKFTKFGKALAIGALSAAIVFGVTSCVESYTVGFLYVTGTVNVSTGNNGIVSGFKIDHNTGRLTPINTLPVASGGANPVRAVLTLGSAEFGCKLFEIDGLPIQCDRAVEIHIDHAPRRRGGKRAFIDHLGHAESDFPLVVDKSCSQHEEDNKQEHDVEHGRQIQGRFFVDIGFQGHGNKG